MAESAELDAVFKARKINYWIEIESYWILLDFIKCMNVRFMGKQNEETGNLYALLAFFLGWIFRASSIKIDRVSKIETEAISI